MDRFAVIIAKNGSEVVETAVPEKPNFIVINSLMRETDGCGAKQD